MATGTAPPPSWPGSGLKSIDNSCLDGRNDDLPKGLRVEGHSKASLDKLINDVGDRPKDAMRVATVTQAKLRTEPRINMETQAFLTEGRRWRGSK